MNTQTNQTPEDNELQPIYTHHINVRISDLNYGNHLSFNSLAGMLQECNVRWLKSINLNSTEINIQDNIAWMVKELNIKYISEAFYDNNLVISMYLKSTRQTSITIHYEIDNKTLHKKTSIATCELVFVSTILKKITPIPSCISHALNM